MQHAIHPTSYRIQNPVSMTMFSTASMNHLRAGIHPLEPKPDLVWQQNNKNESGPRCHCVFPLVCSNAFLRFRLDAATIAAHMQRSSRVRWCTQWQLLQAYLMKASGITPSDAHASKPVLLHPLFSQIYR